MALIPPFFLDCVVAIGIQQKQADGQLKKSWIGTGFIFGKHVKTHGDDNEKKDYTVYLVTNKHVLNGHRSIILRFNPSNDQAAKDYPTQRVSPSNQLLWTGHANPKADVGVLQINIGLIQKEGMKFGVFKSDMDVLTKNQLKEKQVSEGDFVYALGFPIGLVAKDRQHVIVRSGVIARIRDLYEKRSTDYTIDAFVFPGNSGGPVITKPEVISIQGTPAIKQAALIGIVKSYIPYRDVAISSQTKRPRITFEENTGLSLVEPVDYILEAIERDLDRKRMGMGNASNTSIA